jgi:hypothetical protein
VNSGCTSHAWGHLRPVSVLQPMKAGRHMNVRTPELGNGSVNTLLSNESCVQLCNSPPEDVKYLGLHLDRRLTWRKHIFTERKQLGMTLTKMQWLLGRKSKLSTSNNFLIYRAILKPLWTYGIQLWGTASTSNIEIPEPLSSKLGARLQTRPGMCRMRLSEGICKHPQLQTKSVTTAISTVRASAHNQTAE